jgi:hypothetical protein
MATNNAGSCKWVMADGRAFTSYQNNCEVEGYLQSKYAPKSSSEYRQFLQSRACAVMQEMRDRNGFVSPANCQCNYNHDPHNAASQARYSWQPSAEYLANKNKCFNQPILAPGGQWSKYC